MIIRVFANTPAEKAGLQVNDRIRSIDGQEVDPEQELTVISNRIRGEKGTKVTLIVERNDQKKEFEAERSEIEIQYVESQMLEGKIGYITPVSYTHLRARLATCRKVAFWSRGPLRANRQRVCLSLIHI